MKRGAAGGGPGSAVLLAFCAAGLVAFNFPMVLLWEGDRTLWGLPLLPLALFGVWAALIAALAWVVERGGDD